jgi:ankyrin repeat protein
LGRICLHYAVENNDIELVRLFCQFRHLMDTPDDCDHTPLHEACYYGRVECAQLLLAAGAMPDAIGIDGKTPMMNACRSNSLSIVKLLANFGAHWGEKEVQAACSRDRIEIVEWMVAHGFPSPESMFPVCVRSRARRTALWFLDKGIKVSAIPDGVKSI